jgi:RHS repeat-associated protein
MVDVLYTIRGTVGSKSAPYYAGSTPQVTTYSYDGLDRLTATHAPDGFQTARAYGVWEETWRDEHGHETTSHFDGHGQVLRIDRHSSGQPVPTTYTYDMRGDRTGVTDALSHQWTWSFDSLRRPYAQHDPDAGDRAYAYDDAGRLLLATDAKQQNTVLTYDPAGRIATRVTADGTTVFNYGEPRAGYFNVGRPTSMTGPGTPVATMDYDAAGRAVRSISIIDGGNYQLDRRYDTGGRLTGLTYPDGEAIGTPGDPLRYDATGHLAVIPGIVTGLTYDAAGRLLQQDNANGTVTTRSYSAERGFLTSIATTCVSRCTVVQNLTYTPDASGMVTSVTSPFAREGWTYQYDDLHRLTAANNLSHPSDTQSWTYDEIGRMVFNSRLGTYSYPSYSSPRPHGPVSVGTASYSYDANGNLTSGGGHAITWNAANLPSTVDSGAFMYGGQGERLQKTVGSSITVYPFGDDYEIKDGTITKYVSVAGLGVVAKRVGGQTFWLHRDRLGSIQAVTDTARNEVQRRTYRPYGEKIVDTTSHQESRGYIGERQDETGLTYLHARYYDPKLGLFLSPDPAGADLNTYAYATGDPVNLLDRSGLTPVFPTEISCPGSPGCPAPTGGGGSPLPGGMFPGGDIGRIPNDDAGTGDPTDTGTDGSGQDNGGVKVPSGSPPPTDPQCLTAACGDDPNEPSYRGNREALLPVLRLASNFFTGLGPKATIAGPNDPRTRQMMNAPGVNFARDQFYRNNTGYYTNFSAAFGVLAGNTPLRVFRSTPVIGYDGFFGGLNLTRQYTGSYRVDVLQGPGGRVNFYVTNSSSAQSLLYGLPLSYPRSDSMPTPGGTTSQTYYWTEPQR